MPVRRLPLVYVQRGRFVQPDGPGRWKPWGEPAALLPKLRSLFHASEGLYLYDLDGQANGVANLPVIQVLERDRVFPWVEAGCRRAEDAVDAFFAGAEAVTLQPRLMPRDELASFTDVAEGDFHLGYAADRTGVAGVRDARELVAAVQEWGATGVVLYEDEAPAWSTIESHARALEAEGVPTTWVSRPGSDWTARVERSGLVHNVVAWEPPA